jgi:hypothetical protein
MTSLLKSSMNGLSGSSSEAVAEGARRATGGVPGMGTGLEVKVLRGARW